MISKKILSSTDADKIKALYMHKGTLEENVNRMMSLINTIERTMSSTEIPSDFQIQKHNERGEYHPTSRETIANELIKERKKEALNWGPKNWNSNERNLSNKLYKELAECIARKFKPNDPNAQAIIHEYYLSMAPFYNIFKLTDAEIFELNENHFEFGKSLELYHKKLPKFIALSIAFYKAERQKKE